MIKNEQLEIHFESQSINVGDKVKIINTKDEPMDHEDYYYLKKFINKTGIISKISKNTSGLYTYRVEFDHSKFGYFYDKDFILIDEDAEK